MEAPLHPSICKTSVRSPPKRAELCIFWWLGAFIPLSLVLPFSKRKGCVLKDPLRLQAGEVFSLSVGNQNMVPPEPILADALPYLSNSGIIRNVI